MGVEVVEAGVFALILIDGLVSVGVGVGAVARTGVGFDVKFKVRDDSPLPDPDAELNVASILFHTKLISTLSPRSLSRLPVQD